MVHQLSLLNVPGAWDEMVTGDGRVRSHWQGLLASLSALDQAGLAERAARIRAQLEADGVTYSVYGDPRGEERPWGLDLVPLILGEAEWQVLEAGLAQRARLLDAILADLYGSQSLLRRGLLPPAILHANPHFLRPARHAARTHDRADGLPGGLLHFYAADLIRGPDGVWRVLADRTETAAGLGHALGNRRVLARVLPEAYRAAHPQRLSQFIAGFGDQLTRPRPGDDGPPRVVLLHAGDADPHRYEHVYLAREFGIPRVEGGDLTVRDGAVWLKTLAGLQKIDVILRKIDSWHADPLELDADSLEGVPGLLTAVRSGAVRLVNALGSALLESPALGPFLPNLAPALMGEELALQSVDTWWCGEPAACETVIDRLDEMVVQSAFSAPGRPGPKPFIGGSLGQSTRRRLIARMRARPAEHVARLPLTHSVSPSLSASGLMPQPVVLRCFLHAAGDRFVVMPGGLARLADATSPFRGSMEKGGISKDVWVLGADQASALPTTQPRVAPLAVHRSAYELQSRVADQFYWLGRQLERIDLSARLLRAALWRQTGGIGGPRDQAELALLARVLANAGLIDQAAAEAPAHSLMLYGALVGAVGADQPLAGHFAALKGTVAAVRDRVSTDLWAALNRLAESAAARLVRARGDTDQALSALDETIRDVASVGGMALENMTRGSGWRFLDLGRRLERALYTTRILTGLLVQYHGSWEAALRLGLELCDSAITYRARYLSSLQAWPALHLVVADADNPRAVGYQIARIDEHLAALPLRETGVLTAVSGSLQLDLVQGIEAFAAGGGIGLETDRRMQMVDFLARLAEDLMALSDGIQRTYFSHVEAPHALVRQPHEPAPDHAFTASLAEV